MRLLNSLGAGVRSWHKPAARGRAEHVCSAHVFQTSSCSAIARAADFGATDACGQNVAIDQSRTWHPDRFLALLLTINSGKAPTLLTLTPARSWRVACSGCLLRCTRRCHAPFMFYTSYSLISINAGSFWQEIGEPNLNIRNWIEATLRKQRLAGDMSSLAIKGNGLQSKHL
jgi:hypothetical protein